MKNKKLLSLILVVLFTSFMLSCENEDITDDDPFNISAMDFVNKMRVGWNLGNTFDAVAGGSTIEELESAWAGTVTTKENIEAIKNAGFDTIRIPVSWDKVADRNDFTIRTDWLFRLMQVIDWAYDYDMYIIINTHHDSGNDGATIFRFLNSNVEKSLEIFEIIWRQIAEFFKWYDEKLIFEPLNEPRTVVAGVPEWTGNAEQYHNINRHYQVFVDTVRATGENNAKRFFIFNTYAANAGTGPMNGLVLPNDPAKDKHIVSYHAYVPNNFCFPRSNLAEWTIDGRNGRDALDITEPMDRFYEKFVTKGIPIIIGEFGAVNKDNAEARGRWVEYYTRSAFNRGMRVIWWDNARTSGSGELFGLLDRRTNEIIYPEIMEGLLKGSRR